MECYTLCSLCFFFWQWKESIMLYVDKTYIQPLIQNNDVRFAQRMQTFRKQVHHSKTDTQQQVMNLTESVQDTVHSDPKDPKKLKEAGDKVF